MDGIHDLGGMQGFGQVEPNDDSVGFHEAWEGIVHSAFVGTMGSRVHDIDEFRHAIERMEPSHYLSAEYYDRWLIAVSTLAIENGVISPETLLNRTKATVGGEELVAERHEPELVEKLSQGVVEGYSAWRGGGKPAFKLGDAVEVRNIHPDGHTRCPGYVRNARGTITEYRGLHAVPDARSCKVEEFEPLYNVAFEMDELWSDTDESRTDSSGDRLRVELWESHLKQGNG